MPSTHATYHVTRAINDWLTTLADNTTLCVAFSGGVDSTVLLHALSQQTHLSIQAVHVNHQLHPDSADWATHCVRVANRWGVACETKNITVQSDAGDSVEALAREKRYDVLKKYVKENTVLVTAHHQQDQAETFLLQALRGSGLAGLASMPAEKPFFLGVLARPLLTVSPESITAYAKENQLTWIDDPSNESTDFDRNYLRHNVLPVLLTRWPSACQTLVRSVNHVQSGLVLQNDLAEQDLQSMLIHDRWVETVDAIKGAMRISVWLALSADRQRNVLRVWLQSLSIPMPSQAKCEAICLQMQARPDANPCISWGDVSVRRYRDTMYAMTTLPEKTQEKRQTRKQTYQAEGVPPWLRDCDISSTI
ncbi:MAG: hypothetical protein DHS20C10_05850 [marine bacterium B5-7]|nr:MAG: hypothetical protein DHS20C10_05850 [marine bacterium B5-7]